MSVRPYIGLFLKVSIRVGSYVVWRGCEYVYTVQLHEPVCHLEELEAPQAPPLRAARTPTP